MLKMVLPALRADLEVNATYADDGAAIRSPIVAYSGKSDPLMPPRAMDAWRLRTPNFLGNSTFPGGHFYLSDHAVSVAPRPTSTACSCAGRTRRGRGVSGGGRLGGGTPRRPPRHPWGPG